MIGARADGQAKPAHVDVLGDGARSHPLREAAVRPSPVVLHVPEPVLGVDQTLGEEGVVRRARVDVRDTLGIAPDLRASLESG